MVSGEKKDVGSMEVGEVQNINVGTFCFDFSFLDSTWKNIDETEFYVYMSDYKGSEYVRRIKVR